MPIPFRIIDGYNLMHALGLARQRYGPGELERRRHRFLRLIADSFAEDERKRITVVFDAGDPYVDHPRESSLDGLRIVFSPPDSDADTEIERLIRRHSAPKQLEVISSDRRLKDAVRRRKGTSITSEEFASRLSDGTQIREGADDTDRTEPASDAERPSDLGDTDYWLKVFGE